MKSNYVLVTFYCMLSAMLLTSCDSKQNIKSISAKYYIHVFETIASIPYEELQNAKVKLDTIQCLPEIIYKKDKNGNNRIDTMIPSNDFYLIGIKDTIITNPQVLLQIEQAISELKISPIKDSLEDVRIICTVEYQNGKKDYLDIDGKWTDGLNFNRHVCKNDLKLIYLIKKNIGYYYGMHESMFRVFQELADTCFKDTIINEQGQKYWRGKYPPLI